VDLNGQVLYFALPSSHSNGRDASSRTAAGKKQGEARQSWGSPKWLAVKLHSKLEQIECHPMSSHG
jgi:hypothetical protein